LSLVIDIKNELWTATLIKRYIIAVKEFYKKGEH